MPLSISVSASTDGDDDVEALAKALERCAELIPWHRRVTGALV